MIDFTSENTEICVIGRLDFNTGIGSVCFAACELLSRYFPTSIYPINSAVNNDSFIFLPNGKKIPICNDLSKIKVFFFTDVLWNGEYDYNYNLIPEHGLKIAHIAYDSDELPARWVDILNNRFDAAYFMSHHLEEVAKKSGVKIPVGTLPCGLELEPLLLRTYKKNNNSITFGSVAAFHPRKGVDTLAEAFLQEFENENDVELILHSNLSMGTVYEELTSKIKEKKTEKIKITHENLSSENKTKLVESFDIFVNCSRGEGYSIGPREALALGKILVLSEIGPHTDLLNLPGTFGIKPCISHPARYPEIDNQIFGYQYSVSVSDTRVKLREAYNFFKSFDSVESIRERKERASEFAFSKLAFNYAETIVPDLTFFKKNAKKSSYAKINDQLRALAKSKNGEFGNHLSAVNRFVLPAHDGGFFSVFNSFMSHLAWDLPEDRCHMVLPDWDVGRLLKNQKDEKLVSFCYGKITDGNIWLKLFQPLYNTTQEQMNNEEFLYSKSSRPTTIWNQDREPLLTYVHAYDLYKSPGFNAFRKQYHLAYKQHVHLLPVFQNELDLFWSKNFNGKRVLAAHIKHPSHIIEQPGMCIAHGQSFIERINERMKIENLSFDDDNWAIFLATDQDKVVEQFKEAFGDRVKYYTDVRRTKIKEDEIYESLSDKEKAMEGFQVQHLVAATPENWSTRMAWEVIRDAMTLAKCHVLFHVVSNVSTAVSYFNPDIELVFMEP